MLPELPAEFATTRGALHAVAEQVLAAASYASIARIGLRPSPRGFSTQVLADGARVHVDATAIVCDRATDSRRHQLTTLQAASAFLGVPLGAPPVYTAATAWEPDRPLAVDRDAALALGDWFALVAALLLDVRANHPDVSSTESQIWPEHFDLACEVGDAAAGTRANFGASPGDAAIPEPYLYVGPWEAGRRTGLLGTHPFGGARTYSELRRAGEAGAEGRQFFESALAQLLG